MICLVHVTPSSTSALDVRDTPATAAIDATAAAAAVAAATCHWSQLTLTASSPFRAHTILQNNLKKRYDAEWALVTGASSGIGRAIVEKLASQGVNVVMAALDDELLATSHKELSKQYPDLKFVKLGCVVLARVGCMRRSRGQYASACLRVMV